MKDTPLLSPDQFRAEHFLCNEVADTARPFIRAALAPHAFNWSADRPFKLSWLRGIWMNGHRGMILTADERSVLWAAVEAPKPDPIAAPPPRFTLHLLELGSGIRGRR